MVLGSTAGRAARLACTFSLLWVTAASAQALNLHDFLFGGAGAGRAADFSLPTVARYQSDRGESFVLDRTAGRRAILKFEGAAELMALSASPGPRGDVIYRDDMGQPVLRATRLGGLTLFTPADPAGSAAAAVSAAATLRLQPVYGPEAMLQVLVQASGRASRAVQHLVVFDASDAVATPATEPIFADAFLLTADAIVRTCARGPAGHQAAGRVTKVHFVQGVGAEAEVIGRIMQITIAPELGVAGRPSSERIATVLWRRR